MQSYKDINAINKSVKSIIPEFDVITDRDPYSKGFEAASLKLSLNMKNIIYRGNQNGLIPVDSIEKSIISKKMKTIVTIVNLHKKLAKKDINVFEYIDYHYKELNVDFASKGTNMLSLEIENMIDCKYFQFYIQIDTGVRIEILMDNYASFKEWVNGVSILVKNKGNLNYYQAKINLV
jgi:hypothetical protein